MKRIEIIDELCFEGEGSPYPLEALFTLEGMRYVELIKLLRAHEKGDGVTPWEELKGAERREMAQALGADDDAQLARSAAAGLDAVSIAAKRSGVKIQLAPNNRAELVQMTAAFISRGGVWENSVGNAAEVLRWIDEHIAGRSTEEPEEEPAEPVTTANSELPELPVGCQLVQTIVEQVDFEPLVSREKVSILALSDNSTTDDW